MRDEFINLSIMGVIGVFAAGLLLGATIYGDHIDAPHIVLLIMLMVVLRKDARENEISGTYTRGWFVWRRTGPLSPNRKGRPDA